MQENKPRYYGQQKAFYNSYRLVFRDVSGPKNTRTVISTIIPPKTFIDLSLRYVIIKQHDHSMILNHNYLFNISYLCGIFNSTLFDFMARQILQVHVSTIINKIPIPTTNKLRQKITSLTAQLIVGSPNFEEFAEKMHIPNKKLTVAERIDTVARLDAIVAKAYGLDRQEYKTILDSFTSFRENPNLWDKEEVTWDNSSLKEFYGEMRKKALEIFGDVS